MVFLLTFSALSIDNKRGGWDGRQGEVTGVTDGKSPCLEHPMCRNDAHTVANDTPVGYIHSWREQTQILTAQCAHSMSAIVPAITLEYQGVPFRGAGRLTFNT